MARQLQLVCVQSDASRRADVNVHRGGWQPRGALLEVCLVAVALTEQQQLAEEATAHLIQKYSPSGSRIGWMMIASIFIEAWDLYSISFLLVFLTAQYHPPALLLGLASAGTQAGAIVGALVRSEERRVGKECR